MCGVCGFVVVCVVVVVGRGRKKERPWVVSISREHRTWKVEIIQEEFQWIDLKHVANQ